MTENEISYLVRGAIFRVYYYYGPGIFESTYETVLAHELRTTDNLNVKTQVMMPIIYNGKTLDKAYCIDMIIEDKVILEIKSVEKLSEVCFMQLLTYLKLSELKLGLLVNFKTDKIAKSIFRLVNNL